ncbi:hypothetical protein JVU11DRAFT_7504 [Chiua virens]|nr:hypothetical protein JVU11DRAFT_7504 [Chiua virens]
MSEDPKHVRAIKRVYSRYNLSRTPADNNGVDTSNGRDKPFAMNTQASASGDDTDDTQINSDLLNAWTTRLQTLTVVTTFLASMDGQMFSLSALNTQIALPLRYRIIETVQEDEKNVRTLASPGLIPLPGQRLPRNIILEAVLPLTFALGLSRPRRHTQIPFQFSFHPTGPIVALDTLLLYHAWFCCDWFCCGDHWDTCESAHGKVIIPEDARFRRNITYKGLTHRNALIIIGVICLVPASRLHRYHLLEPHLYQPLAYSSFIQYHLIRHRFTMFAKLSAITFFFALWFGFMTLLVSASPVPIVIPPMGLSLADEVVAREPVAVEDFAKRADLVGAEEVAKRDPVAEPNPEEDVDVEARICRSSCL